jgi:hypothetical protein
MEITRSETIGKLAEALAKAQGEMKAVIMNATNPFLHNKYADLGAIIETSKPPLSKYELSFSQIVFSDENKIGVTTLLMHSSGEWLSSSMSLPMGEEKGKSLAQVAGSVITYIRRYSLSAILGIHTEEDSDGNTKKSKAEATEANKETADAEKKVDLIKETQAKILDKLNYHGGSKNLKLMTLLKTYIESGNPMKIKDQDKLNKLLTELENFKNEKEG